VREKVFFGLTEIMAFVEMCREQTGVPVYVRVWRCDDVALKLSQVLPEAGFWLDCHEKAQFVAVVFDLKHEGDFDSSDAHYTLLPSGSLLKE
jgi:hypothetical protein